MASSVKCKNCGEWNKIENSAKQKCVNCGAIVKDPTIERQEKIKKFKQEQLDKWMFTIKEDDNSLVKFAKKTGNITYIVIMSIVGFFAWLAAVLPL
jgi:transcription initiation factor TFIIIB Brf1 subunit/transcription initiation factor TFIIB